MFFIAPEREYRSNDALLQTVAQEAGYVVDVGAYRLVAVDIRDDATTFQYVGRRRVEEQAWVIRFAEKSTEQDPVGLKDVYSFAKVLQESRREFELVEERERELAGTTVRYVRYSFRSPISEIPGESTAGSGILAVLDRQENGQSLIYQIKLDNYGGQLRVDWSDLEPFLTPILGPEAPQG